MICLTNRHLDCPLFCCKARRKQPEHGRSEGETQDVAKCFSLLLELCALYSDRARSFSARVISELSDKNIYSAHNIFLLSLNQFFLKGFSVSLIQLH